MKKVYLILGMAFLYSTSFAATRLITCKGTGQSNNPDFQEFRINVSQKEKTGELQATVGASFTIMNTSHIWKIQLSKENNTITVTNINKTPFKLVINLNEKFQVDNVKGFKAFTQTQFIAKPTYTDPYEVIINDGAMACAVSKSLLQ